MQSTPVVDLEASPPNMGHRLPSAWFLEARFVISCARATVSEAMGRRIRESAQQSMDWPLVLDLARYHGVGPLLYRTVNTVCPDLAPTESLHALRQATLAGTLLNRALAHELIRFCRAFTENGLPVIPFKGVTLGVMAYGDMNLRDFDDLDFIVPQHPLANANGFYGLRVIGRETVHGKKKLNRPTPMSPIMSS